MDQSPADDERDGCSNRYFTGDGEWGKVEEKRAQRDGQTGAARGWWPLEDGADRPGCAAGLGPCGGTGKAEKGGEETEIAVGPAGVPRVPCVPCVPWLDGRCEVGEGSDRALNERAGFSLPCCIRGCDGVNSELCGSGCHRVVTRVSPSDPGVTGHGVRARVSGAALADPVLFCCKPPSWLCPKRVAFRPYAFKPSSKDF